MKNIGIILAGGLGRRFNGNRPKQYMKLNGKEIISYSINALKNSINISDFICVLNKEEYLEKNIENKFGVKCILGGKDRNESISKSLDYISNNYSNCENIIILEAARPFIKEDIVDNYLELLDNYDAVVTASRITDSIGYINGQNIDREKLLLIQAPEAFRYDKLRKNFKENSEMTATVHQLPEGSKVLYNYNNSFNIKVTYAEDLFIAEQLIKLKYFNNKSIIDKGKIKDKKVLLFGGSGGVGSEIIKLYKKLGAEILYPKSNEIDLETVTVNELLNYCNDFRPDIIINSAAYSANDDDGLIREFDKIFKINLKSNLIMIEFAKLMNKKVNIVLFSSSSSTKGRENIALYSATKLGINSLIESLSKGLRKLNIYLNAIAPEKIKTPMIQKLHNGDVIDNELLSIEDVMSAVIHYSLTEDSGDVIHIRKGF